MPKYGLDQSGPDIRCWIIPDEPYNPSIGKIDVEYIAQHPALSLNDWAGLSLGMSLRHARACAEWWNPSFPCPERYQEFCERRKQLEESIFPPFAKASVPQGMFHPIVYCADTPAESTVGLDAMLAVFQERGFNVDGLHKAIHSSGLLPNLQIPLPPKEKRRTDAILKELDKRGLERLAFPRRNKKFIGETLCREQPALFTAATFKTAWQNGIRNGFFRTIEHERFSKNAEN